MALVTHFFDWKETRDTALLIISLACLWADQMASFSLNVLKSIPFVDDGPLERLKWPAITIIEGGDCDDKVLLALAWMYYCNLLGGVILYKLDGSESYNHIAVAIRTSDDDIVEMDVTYPDKIGYFNFDAPKIAIFPRTNYLDFLISIKKSVSQEKWVEIAKKNSELPNYEIITNFNNTFIPKGYWKSIDDNKLRPINE